METPKAPWPPSAVIAPTLRNRVGQALVPELIYPSPRRDAATEVVNGVLTRWTGWCFVDYVGSPEIPETLFETFENYLETLWIPATLSEAARIYRSSDPLFSGSFTVQGLKDDRWGLISAITETAKGERNICERRGPRWFSREESESLSRALIRQL